MTQGQATGGLIEWSLSDLLGQPANELTAVEEFSRIQPQLSAATYRALMPATAPGPGEQYAFEVDLDRCSGCKACVTACHSLNGLDDRETWREVGLLTGGIEQRPFMQHVTTACHHCLEPACMEVCPTLAYEKDAATGIVKHLDDQCFGCQYCILACPYNVPKYNPRLGIVRKCDMCSQRLGVGEAPACVQACPHEAIKIQIVSVAQVQDDCEAGQFLPGTPDSRYTLPTTSYRTERAQPRNLIPADYFRVQTEHSHGPLVAMLVLTQLSVGGFAVGAAIERWFGPAMPASFRLIQSAASLVICYVALGASLMHLGRPWLAYRAMLGLRRSWLSREILAFGLFAGAATGLTSTFAWPQVFAVAVSLPVLQAAVVATGAAGVFCSAMIYHRTKRPFWNIHQTGTRFGLTAVLLGLSLTWLVLAALARTGLSVPVPLFDDLRRKINAAIFAVALLKGLLELSALAPWFDRLQTPLKRSAMLLVGPLRRSLVTRFCLLLAAGMIVPVSALGGQSPTQRLVLATMSLAGLIVGELIERSLFFKASVAFRMPGGPSA